MNAHETTSATPARPAVTSRRFGYGIANQIVVACAAAVILGIGALMPLLPAIAAETDHSGDWILAIPSVLMLGIGTFMVFGTIAIVRTVVRIDATMLDAVIVSGHTWYLWPHFRRVRLPLAEIRSVERRTALFKSFGVPNMRQELSIVTASGERIGMLSSTPSGVSMDVDQVAEAIASAAGLAVVDDGTVRSKFGGLYGADPSSWTETPLDAQTARKAQRVVMRSVQIATALLMLTFLVRACA